jgi:hypothetical protein
MPSEMPTRLEVQSILDGAVNEATENEHVGIILRAYVADRLIEVEPGIPLFREAVLGDTVYHDGVRKLFVVDFKEQS